MNPSTKKTIFLFLVCACLFYFPFLNAQQSTALLKDINTPGPTQISALSTIAEINGKVIYTSYDNNFGLELWSTDGTVANSQIIKDINPGIAGSNPSSFIRFGDLLIFTANNGQTGSEIWATDGTSDGTLLLKDIFPGNGSSSPNSFLLHNGYIYFNATDQSGLSRWRTDGTPGNTVKDPGVLPKLGIFGAYYNGKYYFRESINGSFNNLELVSWDGISATTQVVKDIFPGDDSSFPSYFTVFNGKLYFSAQDRHNNRELWVTDGTEAGTQLVEDLQSSPNGNGGNPSQLIVAGNHLYFPATSDADGYTLFRLNDTEDGIDLVKDFAPIGEYSAFTGFLNLDGILLLGTANGITGEEVIWRTEGEEANTTEILNLSAIGRASGGIINFNRSFVYQANGIAYFRVGSSNNDPINTALYQTDGTVAGTQLVKDGLFPSVSSFDIPQINGDYYFAATEGNTGSKLWKNNNGDIQAIAYLPIESSASSFPSEMCDFNGQTLFTATSYSNGTELWKTDGSESGTQFLKDIFPGEKGSFKFYSEFKRASAVYQNQFYFVADDGTNLSIWRTDGSEAGTAIYHILKPSEEGQNTANTLYIEMEVFDGALYFSRAQNESPLNGLYKITAPNTAPILVSNSVRPNSLIAVGNLLYFLQSDIAGGTEYEPDFNIQLYKTDGTNAGTEFIRTLAYSDYYRRATVNLLNIDNKLAINIKEYYDCRFYYDEELVIENPDAFLLTQSPVFFQNALYFGNNWNPDDAGTTGALYKWENNTRSIVKAFPAFRPGPSNITILGSKMIFNANGDDAVGNELWISDGTEAGTLLLKDLYPGSEDSNPDNFLAHNGQVYFTASDALGRHIYQTDGTAAGTIKFATLPGAPDNFDYPNLHASGHYLYFTYDDGQIGTEPYKVDLSIAPPMNGPDLNLSLSISNSIPEIYTNTTITASISNTGNENASGIIIELPTPAGELAFTSSNSSQGTYSSFFDEWNVGSLAAGQSATLELTLFTLTDNPIDYFAQVKSMNENDLDSSPNNGTCCIAGEDDEAYLSINGSGMEGPDLQLANFNAAPSGDPGAISNFSIDLINSGNALAYGDYQVGIYLSTDNSLSNNDIEVGVINTGNTHPGTISDIPGAITIPAGQAPGNYFLIAKIDHTDLIVELDENNNTFSTNFEVNGQNNCSISLTPTTPTCSDNNTPNNPSDDRMNFLVDVTGTNSSAVLTLLITNAAGTDQAPVNNDGQAAIGVALSDGPVTIEVLDPANPACNASILIPVISPCSNSGGGVDLALEMLVSEANPSIYTNTTVTLRLVNTGTEIATGATVDFQIPNNYAFVSQQINDGSYSNWNGEWKIPAVAPGASASMELTIFALDSGPTNLYAQVIQQNETDIDSNPNNGNPPTPNEDDEVRQILNDNQSGCSIDDLGLVITCLDQGTASPSDDRFTFSLNITGTNLGATYNLISANFGWQNVSYNQPGLAGTFLISDGDIDITITDDSGNCSASYTIPAPAPCSSGSLCNISEVVVEAMACDDRGTPENGDDEFYFEIQPIGTNLSATYSIPEIVATTGILYTSDYITPNFPISDGAVSLTIVDDSGDCSFPINVHPPAPCSQSSGSEIDLEIDLGTVDFNPAQYSTFSVTVAVSNNSSNDATGVAVEFPVPDGFVLSGGNEYSASQGSYTVYGGSTWTVGNLPAGGSATIAFNLFVLDDAQTTFFAQVSAANEDDIDSTPNNNNGVCCTVEDDEEFININIGNLNREGLKDKSYLSLQQLYPNPVMDQIQVIVQSPAAKQTAAKIYNNLGQLVWMENWNLNQGVNQLGVDVSSLPSGLYYFHLPEAHVKQNQLRFIKERN